MERHKYLFKILLMGDKVVGKTSIIKRYVFDEYKDNYLSTIGVDFFQIIQEIDDHKVVFQLWDRENPIGFKTTKENIKITLNKIFFSFVLGYY